MPRPADRPRAARSPFQVGGPRDAAPGSAARPPAGPSGDSWRPGAQGVGLCHPSRRNRGEEAQEWTAPWVLDDPFALILVGPEWPALMDLIRPTFRGPVLNEVMASAVARSRYGEDRFERGGRPVR
jgi:hypothetical protein